VSIKGFLVVSGLSAAVLFTWSASVPASSSAQAATTTSERYWPQWRGPLGTGEAPHAKPPVEWNQTKNVRWKVPLPGLGKSTPVVWNDLVLVTTAVPKSGSAAVAPSAGSAGEMTTHRPAVAASMTQASAATVGGAQPPPAQTDPGPGGQGSAGPGREGRHPAVRDPEGPQQFVVMAFNRTDGKLRWQRVVHEELPHEGTHQDGTFASGSAITDGRRIYVYFGSRGLYALDLNGKVLWDKQFGKMQTRNGFGEGNSPALYDGTLVIAWDHEGPDYVIGLDAATGNEKWRRERDEPTTWATPHVVVHGGKPQVVLAGTNRMVAYDLATGEPLWQAGGLTANQIPSPVSADGMVYAMGGFRGNMLRAIRLSDAKGEVTGPPALAFSYDRNTPYVPSPLVYRGGLYFLKSNSGILTYMDAKSGEAKYTERLPVPNVYASPVAADGRVYIVGREGTTVVLAAGPKLEVLATNVLDDPMDSSPALVDGDLFMRSARHLYRIAATN
jgi:outer membrane protein assembly factor BamB